VTGVGVCASTDTDPTCRVTVTVGCTAISTAPPETPLLSVLTVNVEVPTVA